MATERIDRLRRLLDERIVVLDGAWGVLLQGRGITEEDWRGERFAEHSHDVKGNPDLLNLTKPDLVSEIHRAYFEAGADIATTNTFTATSIGQADYALESAVAEMNLAGARLAREAADDHDGFVAGSVGPLNVSLSLSPKVDDAAYRSATFDQVRDAYAEQIRALAEGGVDILLIETVFDTLNAKAAIVAAHETAPDLPLWLSFTAIDLSGRNLSGQTVEAFWLSVEHAKPLIVGVNCSLGAAQIDDRRGDPQRHLRRHLARSDDRRLRVQRVEDRLQQQQVDATLDEPADLLRVRLAHLVERVRAVAGVVDARAERERDVERPDRPRDVAVRPGLVGDRSREPRAGDVHLVHGTLERVVGLADRGRRERVGGRDVGARLEVRAVDLCHDLGLRQVEEVGIALDVPCVRREEIAAPLLLGETTALQEDAPRAVEHEDPLPRDLPDLGCDVSLRHRHLDA